ncbi:precorrin-6A synthase (deacetylating) [Aeromicrobium sp. CF3.5]|uniref:precorrin-6A synthase (deacetylating) n=1 Tax=Aeromicrobium sp. CF3.5 TaxID=3373078 RepID=UPI003EE4BA28
MSPARPVRRLTVVGIGAGDPDQITVEAAETLRAADFAIVAQKRDDDPLVAARQAVIDRHAPGLQVVAVPDPERDRSAAATSTTSGYAGVVVDWHDARAALYEQVLLDRPDGDVVFLVWGDPAFYDSTIRVVEKVLAAGRADFVWDVIPGISALQVLAARHRIVLHDVGQALLVTTGRRLREAVDGGADNVLVMLSARFDLDGLEDWHIWWGANLGTAHESLVAGRVGDVLGDVERARAATKASAGWVMDVYLLRAP